MSILRKKAREGKEAEQILSLLKETRQLLGAYREFIVKYASENDITPDLVFVSEKIEASLLELLRNPL